MAVDNRPLNIIITIVAVTFAYLVYDYFVAVPSAQSPGADSCLSDSDCPAIYCIRAPCPQSVCENNRCVMTEAPEETPVPTEPIETVRESGGCKIGGCSGQLCSDASEGPMFTTCEWSEAYGCYQELGVCERQEGGKCGWTQTDVLKQCLLEKS
ncbi:MAG: hypothetical protein HY833_00135 [Candidatus Aenigmarchaeota archaeon]|nr:hypothetical protein [Candidatus Aenigmarchaeota archaeon]